MWVVGQRHGPAALSLEKTWYPHYRRLGGPQVRSGRVGKSRLHRDSIPGPSLYRLSYSGPPSNVNIVYIFPTHCMCVFHMTLRIKQDYFHKQPQEMVFITDTAWGLKLSERRSWGFGCFVTWHRGCRRLRRTPHPTKQRNVPERDESSRYKQRLYC
jgi:hypothetical protein